MQILFLLWAANLLACVMSILLAVAGIFFTAHSRLRQALLLAAPAFVFGILTNILFAFFWFATRPFQKNNDAVVEAAHLLLKDWVYVAIVPLALSLFVAFLVQFHRGTPQKSLRLARSVNIGFTLVFVLVFTGNAIGIFCSPRIYTSTTLIRVTPDWSSSDDRNFAAAVCRAINSTNVLNRAVAGLDLNVVWGKKFNNGFPFKTWESATVLKGRLEAVPLKDTSKIRITMYSDDPYEAATLANGLVAAYRDYCASESAFVSDVRHPAVTILDPAEPVLTPTHPSRAIDLLYGVILAIVIAGFVGGFVILIADLLARQPRVSYPHSIPGNSSSRY